MNLKKYTGLGIAMFFSLLAPAQQPNGFVIDGELTGLKDGTKIYLVRNKPSRKGVDTITWTQAKGEKFRFAGSIPYEGEEHFIFIDKSAYDKPVKKIIVFLENREAKLKGTLADLSSTAANKISEVIQITGLPAHDDYAKYMKAQVELVEQVNKQISVFHEEYKQVRNLELFNKNISNANQPVIDFKEKWIAEHPSSLLTPWLIYNKRDSIELMRNDYEKLSTEAKNSKWGRALHQLISTEENIQVGDVMPEFTFPSIDGELLSLSEITAKSKLVFVDFWASWCGPCIKSFPGLKALYQKYQDKGFEIVGYSTDVDSAEVKWKYIIERLELPWPNVRQTERGYSKRMYNIEKLPSNYLIDNNGVIIARDLYDEELEKKINEWLQFETGSKVEDNAKFADEIAIEKLKQHVYTLAGDEMEGRRGGTNGELKASAYIINQFIDAGLVPVVKGGWKQSFTLFTDTLVKSAMTVGKNQYQPAKDYYYFTKANEQSQDLKTNQVVFAGYGINNEKYDDYNQLDVKGKVVLVLAGEPLNADSTFVISGTTKPSGANDFFIKQRTATEKGAKAILIVDDHLLRVRKGKPYFRSLPEPTFKREEKKGVINLYYISSTMASEIMHVPVETIWQQMQKGIPAKAVIKKPIHIQYIKKTEEYPFKPHNILGIIEGSDKKDEYVFVTAHYDHLGRMNDSIIKYGADDNASGTSAVLEIARAFAKAKKEGRGPRRSIVFMLATCEEKGLWGSQHYSENPVFPLSQTVVDLNIDMVGRTGTDFEHDKDSVNYVLTIGDDSLSTELRALSEQVNEQYMQMKLDRTDPASYYTRSDHYNFAKHGIPVIFYTNGIHPDYHMPTDTPDKINYELLQKRAQLVFYTAWELANREERVKVNRKPAHNTK